VTRSRLYKNYFKLSNNDDVDDIVAAFADGHTITPHQKRFDFFDYEMDG